MCGIVGILARKTQIPLSVLERATLSLAHRGPDDSGTVLVKETHPEPLEIGFGHRRLSILDLSPLGHQPMQDPVTASWIVFNGEIYNFRALKKELEENGVTFQSNCDTEVILAAYRVWGESSLTRLKGMFAFAIWDAPLKRLLLARDPMGIKPLYYSHSDQTFIFASEVRTILGT
jgi:asparagine synthase (glutamine-hydrolysing)